jgi:SAM-dependent methyltransferase
VRQLLDGQPNLPERQVPDCTRRTSGKTVLCGAPGVCAPARSNRAEFACPLASQIRISNSVASVWNDEPDQPFRYCSSSALSPEYQGTCDRVAWGLDTTSSLSKFVVSPLLFVSLHYDILLGPLSMAALVPTRWVPLQVIPNDDTPRCRVRKLPTRVSRRQLLSAVVEIPTLGITMAADGNGEAGRKRSGWWPPDNMKRQFAEGMETGMGDYELAVANRKRELFSRLGNEITVLDVGIGTGPNLAYLPSGSSCVGLEPNKFMWPYVRRKVEGLATRGISLRLLQGSAEAIPCESESFDVVLCTLTLCSVTRPEQALREIQRVLKPGGSFLFVEHVCASGEPLLRAAQTILSPLQVLLADGCHLNRDTAALIRKVGTDFDTIDIENFTVDLGVDGALISRQISGIATKRGKT